MEKWAGDNAKISDKNVSMEFVFTVELNCKWAHILQDYLIIPNII